MDAFKVLQKMTFSKSMNKTVVKAVRVRLEFLLAEQEKSYLYWQDNICHKLNRTRQKEIRRKFEKTITAFKITIHELTPFYERTEDTPLLINRRR